jgi:hypothetical protein
MLKTGNWIYLFNDFETFKVITLKYCAMADTKITRLRNLMTPIVNYFAMQQLTVNVRSVERSGMIFTYC